MVNSKIFHVSNSLGFFCTQFLARVGNFLLPNSGSCLCVGVLVSAEELRYKLE